MASKESPPTSPKPLPRSFAEVCARGLSRSYGQAVKATFPALSFCKGGITVERLMELEGFHVSIPAKEEWSLTLPFRWVIRGIFRVRCKAIAKINEVICSTIQPKGSFQVSPFSNSEVLIHCQEPMDAIKLLTLTSIKIDGIPMRLLRWSPLPANSSFFYTWGTLRGIPPHLCSLQVLKSILKYWGYVIVVDDDARFMTRTEAVRVFLEVDASSPPPKSFHLHSLGGILEISLELQRTPIICSACGKLGHGASICRSTGKNPNSNDEGQAGRGTKTGDKIPSKEKKNPTAQGDVKYGKGNTPSNSVDGQDHHLARRKNKCSAKICSPIKSTQEKGECSTKLPLPVLKSISPAVLKAPMKEDPKNYQKDDPPKLNTFTDDGSTAKPKVGPQNLTSSMSETERSIDTLPGKWSDIPSDEDDPLEDNHSFKDAPEDFPGGEGKKIISRISQSEALQARTTRSGRSREISQEEADEKWIDGFRLVHVKKFDQRHNTTWYKWETDPEVVISRKQKKRIENLANMCGNS